MGMRKHSASICRPMQHHHTLWLARDDGKATKAVLPKVNNPISAQSEELRMCIERE